MCHSSLPYGKVRHRESAIQAVEPARGPGAGLGHSVLRQSFQAPPGHKLFSFLSEDREHCFLNWGPS